MSQISNKTLQRGEVVPSVGANLSLVSGQGASEIIAFILTTLVPILPLILTSWVTLNKLLGDRSLWVSHKCECPMREALNTLCSRFIFLKTFV